MRYIAYDSQTNNNIGTFLSLEELEEEMDRLRKTKHRYYAVKVHSCRGCDEYKDDIQEYSDWYGITTGHWCQDCYENKYPYRKDRYPTEEYDGYGERLDDDY